MQGDSNISKLAMKRSTMIPEGNSAVKEDEEFKNRKCRKDDARDCVHVNACNDKVFTKSHQRKEELQSVNNAELTHCLNVISEDNHRKKH